MSFYQASFNESYFSNAKFQGVAQFSYTTFKNVDFSNVTFSEARFVGALFQDHVDFSESTFKQGAEFSEATFKEGVNFSVNAFRRNAFFNRTVFEKQNLVIFNKSDEANVLDLSQVSFADSDITRIRFGDRITWNDKNGFSVVEEKWLEQKAKSKKPEMDVSLDLVLSVYRNLRENYEFRLRYDEAGKLFIKEMELKRNHRTVPKKKGKGTDVEENNFLRKHFSLTGLYFHFSTYGESIVKPTIIGVITVGLSTLFWLIQNNPTLEPSLSFVANDGSGISNFINTSRLEVWNNSTQLLKAFERSISGFIPLLPPPSEIKVGVIDYIIKIVGGALTFGLLIIAFRRKFERKYTR